MKNKKKSCHPMCCNLRLDMVVCVLCCVLLSGCATRQSAQVAPLCNDQSLSSVNNQLCNDQSLSSVNNQLRNDQSLSNEQSPSSVNSQWIHIESIDVFSNGNVILTWPTAQIRMDEYHYVVCMAENLMCPVTHWDSYSTTSPAIVMDRSVASVHKMTIGNEILNPSVMFFRVKAVKDQNKEQVNNLTE